MSCNRYRLDVTHGSLSPLTPQQCSVRIGQRYVVTVTHRPTRSNRLLILLYNIFHSLRRTFDATTRLVSQRILYKLFKYIVTSTEVNYVCIYKKILVHYNGYNKLLLTQKSLYINDDGILQFYRCSIDCVSIVIFFFFFIYMLCRFKFEGKSAFLCYG